MKSQLETKISHKQSPILTWLVTVKLFSKEVQHMMPRNSLNSSVKTKSKKPLLWQAWHSNHFHFKFLSLFLLSNFYFILVTLSIYGEKAGTAIWTYPVLSPKQPGAVMEFFMSMARCEANFITLYFPPYILIISSFLFLSHFFSLLLFLISSISFFLFLIPKFFPTSLSPLSLSLSSYLSVCLSD